MNKTEPMERSGNKQRHCVDPPRRQNASEKVAGRPGDKGGGRPEDSESAADMARQLLAERASHCCSCDLAVKKGIAGVRGGRGVAEASRGPGTGEALLGGEGATVDGPSSIRGRISSRQDEDRDDCSIESTDTLDEKLPYHVHIVDRCPNGDPIVTFVPEPETNGKRRLLCLPVVVSKCWGPDQYPAEKPARCVAKAMISMVTLLLLAVVCFLAGYFTVDLQDEESTSPYRQGPVRIVVESSLLQPYLTSYSDSSSKSYQEFSYNFSKAIDGVFATSDLHAEYSHCSVDRLRRGSVIVEFTIYLLGAPATRQNKEGAPMDVETTTPAIVEGILKDAITSGRLYSMNMDRESIRVTQVFFDVVEGPSAIPPTLWPEGSTELKIEPGLVNQRGCGSRPGDWHQLDRIVGGKDSKPGRWPWLGSMRYWLGDGFGHRCAASLLNPEWAITAAHCVDGGVGDILDHIIFGDHELGGASPSRQKVGVERVAVHPGFSISRHDNDLALLKLTRRVRFDQNVSPVCVETESYEVERYRECYIAGWGHTAESGNISELLQEAPIPLVNKEVCFRQFRDQVSETFSVITDNMICAGRDTGGVDSCQSDSGGPLMCLGDDRSWRVVGLTSFGYGCGRPELSGVYTRVSRYWDYISSAIRGEPSVHCQELTEPTCLGHLPYTKVFPNSQGDLAFFLGLLPNTSHPDDSINNTSSVIAHSSQELRETLVCLAVMPSCQETGAPPIVPCWEFCRATVDYTFAILARCERYPTGVTSDSIFCTQGINADCGPTQLYPSTLNHTVIVSPYLPGSFVERSIGCTWRVTGPPGTSIVFKFNLFKLPSSGRGKVINIGEGNDTKNRTSRLYKLFGLPIPRPLLVESNQAWLSYSSMSELFDDMPEEFHFIVEVHAVDIHEKGFSDDICRIGLGVCNEGELCHPDWWRCDSITDCARGEDEASCPTYQALNATFSTTPPR